jgi:ketosteroid isomerase-like protein
VRVTRAILERVMSEANVAVVRGMFEALIRGDGATALAAFDPDVEWDGTNFPDGEVSRGRQAIVEHMARWRETWETWEVAVDDVFDAARTG